jgi:hypothetical protein
VVAVGRLGLEYVGAGHAVQRLAEDTCFVAQEHGLVLHAGEAEAQTLILGMHSERMAREFFDQCVELVVVEPAHRGSL